MLTYFIADLHLTKERSDITECFLRFIEQQAPLAERLYILGDFFEYWIGDDDDNPFVLTIADQLKQLSDKGTEIFFIQGNRDFLLGKKFADRASMTLLPDSQVIDIYGQRALIMHGDTLCTRDVEYQKFRKKSRSWWWQWIVKALPLSTRRKMAEDYRKKADSQGPMTNNDIMDVSQDEVVAQMRASDVQLLIHGHTHRPNVHTFELDGKQATRIVLGDWYEQGAWLKFDEHGFELLNEPLITP
ncbi:UDP-2,3-diacylglucosamine diphosphatase [Thalassotalea ponticola]|uniref:UDP-2,3-diacylglucosamine diphosphatase n=1 Tax=Thalassotalea ponticola TaxID=1523392 RepID=UPI0025B2B6F1|nr:UDP-2,3-diacylglucosamine diphosphatase [Thalassotalea ponticola]MDN3653901.1 UDP-2,3-diacylglucosamine diphosphatase [Thalassotalea ponticola]